MKRLTALLIMFMLAFYVAWPAWSGNRIAHALRNEDKDLLASKIDFPSVRATLKPVLTGELAARIEQMKRDAGPLGSLIAGQFKDDLVARIVDGTLESMMTPETIIRIVRQGGNLKEAAERVALDQILRPGAPSRDAGDGPRLPRGLPGAPQWPGRPAQAGEPPTPAGETKKSMTWRNIKSFRVVGPLSYSLGIARNAEAALPDAEVTLAFTGGDWKVVGILPKL